MKRKLYCIHHVDLEAECEFLKVKSFTNFEGNVDPWLMQLAIRDPNVALRLFSFCPGE
jgi:hypothetical protein